MPTWHRLKENDLSKNDPLQFTSQTVAVYIAYQSLFGKKVIDAHVRQLEFGHNTSRLLLVASAAVCCYKQARLLEVPHHQAAEDCVKTFTFTAIKETTDLSSLPANANDSSSSSSSC